MRAAALLLVGLTVALLGAAAAHGDRDDDDDDDKKMSAVEAARRLGVVMNGTVAKKAKKGLHRCKDYAEDGFDCGLTDVKDHKYCSLDKCKALVKNMKGRSCAQYCGGLGRRCVGAWEEHSDSCVVEETWTCNQSTKMFGDSTKDVICQCSSADGAPDPCQTPPAAMAADCAVGTTCSGMKTHGNCPGACAKGQAGCLAFACREFAEKLGDDDDDDDDDDLEDAAAAAACVAGVLVLGAGAYIIWMRSRRVTVTASLASEDGAHTHTGTTALVKVEGVRVLDSEQAQTKP